MGSFENSLVKIFKSIFPKKVDCLVRTNLAAIEDFVRKSAGTVPRGGHVVDIGAGECKNKKFFTHTRYTAVDFCQGDPAWNYSQIDVVADASLPPFPNEHFDAAFLIQVLEHVKEPEKVLKEAHRILRKEGRIFLTVPQGWCEHQTPHDYFRFTSFGLRYLFEKVGFRIDTIKPQAGYFMYLGSRISMMYYYIFPEVKRGLFRWFLAPLKFFWITIFNVLIPFFLSICDGIDKKKAFTLGYSCIAVKNYCS